MDITNSGIDPDQNLRPEYELIQITLLLRVALRVCSTKFPYNLR